MQNEIIEKTNLLDENGNIANAGFSKKFLYVYNKRNIKKRKTRLKEWDYYYISNDKFALCLTIADMGYIGSISASVVYFVEKTQITKSSIALFTMGKFGLPVSSENGDVIAKNKNVYFEFLNDNGYRKLKGTFPNFKDKHNLDFEIEITQPPEESMVIATPFKKNKHFYFNQKINCMTANGYFYIGNEKYSFDKTNSLATLDFGRGVWTYDNTWKWASLQGYNDKTKFGFNLGYGFGDTSKATENMLFYNGSSHKLDQVLFDIPQSQNKKDYMGEWQIYDNQSRLKLSFTPFLDRYEPINLGILCMIPHQVFGYYNGYMILDNGDKIEIKNQIGFAEEVHNKL